MDKVIISCALTGSIHTPSMSKYLPLTPDEIAQQAINAAGAGAAILHLHARDPKDGRPSANSTVFRQFVPRIAAATDVRRILDELSLEIATPNEARAMLGLKGRESVSF